MARHISAPLNERVAKLALDTFDSLPRKCKPRVHPNGTREWTPMSAVIIGYGEPRQLICVSLATGTKCLPASALPKCSGLVLHDSHAEVLALRGLNYWLLNEIRKLIQVSTYRSPIVELSRATHVGSCESISVQTRPPFVLRESVSFYFFTTEAPCGDASMELLMASMPYGSAEPWKPCGLGHEDMALHGRGHFSMLGFVRRKPARADAEPSNSKSCTDKLAVKQLMSPLSFPTDLFLQKTDSAYLREVIVYADQYHSTAFDRAFSSQGRLSGVAHLNHFFAISPLPSGFPRFPFAKAGLNDSTEQQKPKATNLATLWIRDSVDGSENILEVLVNGVKQGYKQWEPRLDKASTTSRQKMWATAVDICTSCMSATDNSPPETDFADAWAEISTTLSQSTYGEAKSSASRATFKELKGSITHALGNWHSNSGDGDWQRL